ncbi:glycine cleavage system aminomethyltransferase GcvT [Rhodococcus sp. BGS-1C]|jgi:aminomethyltransferase|uniref:glycine cleavage system aminomethyltransferase GcvT n=1 Tax=Nocardiaceae TaxID=85025 RepID=UPI0009677570|nr:MULTISPECIES: glycine cleavage system aminomethyltransferase GcvT [Rhodococcus]MCC8927811.1 glycine cleavage system aminomethyltransferase GcvT [Rhodococcus sp. I2R]MCZ4278555.1 glycine cleavage system aminomethyltransferase GcvT [Rhodococcus yunnanensis]OLT32261.1 glycine cleavage system protein T [Rhodococcus sp. CUA-806]
MSAEELLRGPVHVVHAELGATFAPFGGWEMPVSYAGVVAEHKAVRSTVGLFDVSHLGKVSILGPGAAAFVNSSLTNDLGRVGPGKAQYTLCCTETGGVVDDLIAYFVGDEEVFLVPNAANTAAVVAAMTAHAPAEVRIVDQHRDFGVFAVQGPSSQSVVEQLGLPVDMEYMAFADARWGEIPVRVCRTGYTGEHGYELIAPWADSEALFRELLAVVTAAGGQAAGLGARDTLRTEMGYPLHGHELSLDITPLQARCGWAVGWKKPAFWGKDALLAEKEAGPARQLRGVKALDRGVLRQGQTVSRDGAPVGVTTSGTFSPSLSVGIALALVDTDSALAPGDIVEVDVRGRAVRCEIVAPPFVSVNTK